MAIVEVGQDNFADEVLTDKGLVLVDFAADWCGPCRQMEPILQSLSEETSDLKFTRLDVDKAPAIAADYRVTGIPFVGFFHNGSLVHSFVGARPRTSIEGEIRFAQNKM